MSATITDLDRYRRQRGTLEVDHLSDARAAIASAQAHLIAARPPEQWADCRIALHQLKEIKEDIEGWLSTIKKREPAVHTDSRHAEAHPNVPTTQRGS